MSSTPEPRVSVIVPARDEEAYVAAALASVVAQASPAIIEVIVVVNGSVDRTADVVRSSIGLLDGLAVQLLEDPQAGVSRAKNLGVRAANGDLLIFLDADSRMAPDLTQRVVEAWRAGSQAGSIAIAADGGDILDRAFFGLIEFGKRLFRIRANMLYCERELFLSVGGFDERLYQAEDRDLLVRIAGRGVEVAHVTGSWIATSPRRLHQGPLRVGLVRVFGRWMLGHAGIWRDRPY